VEGYSEERSVKIGDYLDYETEASEFQSEENSKTEKFNATSYTTNQTGIFSSL
jgi:hypothetical protein